MKKLVILLFTFIFINGLIANPTEHDSIAAESNFTDLQISDNLDSLLNLFYVRQSLLDDTIAFENVEDSVIPEFSDSIYIARLNEMPNIVNLSYNKVVRNFI